jgi:hypothetical protein
MNLCIQSGSSQLQSDMHVCMCISMYACIHTHIHAYVYRADLLNSKAEVKNAKEESEAKVLEVSTKSCVYTYTLYKMYVRGVKYGTNQAKYITICGLIGVFCTISLHCNALQYVGVRTLAYSTPLMCVYVTLRQRENNLC